MPRFVEPTVSEEKARGVLCCRKRFFSLKKTRAQPPEHLELLYIPFYLIRFRLSSDGTSRKDGQPESQTIHVGIDGLLGQHVGPVSEGLRFSEDASGTACCFDLEPGEAQRMALEAYRGQLLEHSLRSRSLFDVKALPGPVEVYYPFWVGYFRKKGGYDFRAVDAVSGEVQGIRMRRVFLRAFRIMAEFGRKARFSGSKR